MLGMSAPSTGLQLLAPCLQQVPHGWDRVSWRKDLTASKDRAINSKDETDQGDNNQSLIRVERNNIEIITHLELRSETCDIAQAAHYYNSQVYPDLLSSQLAPNPFIVPLFALHLIPTSIRHSLVTTALSGHLFRSQQSASQDSLTENWSRLHRHRGVAIRALNEEIGKESTRSSDATITSVLTFLIVELQQSISPNWQHHVNGMMAMIRLRGGLKKIVDSAPYLKPSLLSFIIIGVIGNTTSPPSAQIAATLHLCTTNLISELYRVGYYPSFPCPLPLFLDIIRINHLRLQSTEPLLLNETIQFSANELLERINAFSPEQSVKSITSFYDEWLLIARIYHSAVALYCLSSLQSHFMPLSASQSHTTRAAHSGRLFRLLEEALASPWLKKCMMWPLVVAAVEAANSTDFVRGSISKQWSDMSRDQRTSLPLVAQAVIERFWASGKTGWDACFERPYAFVI
ncbi:hypothetical protein MMC20_003521 [Loxospora ochrophaea]|nr:hypothetical protein [Loxospora ochrophaea]